MKRFHTAVFSALMAASVVGGPPAFAAAESPGMALARQLNDAFVSVAEKVSPSVVIIEVTEKPRSLGRRGVSRPQQGEGSGIILTADGYILTNDHVVNNAATNGIDIQLQDGRHFAGKVVGTDPKYDIAVVKIEPKGAKLTPAKLGDSSKLRVGEFVVAIGHPLDLTYSVTYGHVSALGRLVPQSTTQSPTEEPEYIQTDAVINPGNSGGPLLNLDGEVIGVNDMIEAYTDRFTGETVNVGIGLAIPVNIAKAVKDILISHGKFVRSRIGIVMGPLPDEIDSSTPSPKPVASHPVGVQVEEIASGTPASSSDLKIGDIIVAVDKTPVKNPRELYHEISFKTPGQTISLDVLRNEKPYTIKVKTEAAPEEVAAADAMPDPSALAGVAESNYGFSVKDLTKQLANQYGLTATNGVVVTQVELGSPASTKRIAVGSLITKVNNKPVATAKDFLAALAAIKPGQQWTMEIATKDAADTTFLVMRDPRPATQ